MRFLLAFFCTAALGFAAPPLFSEPALSPDHSEIAFVSGGDIWTVPSGGGEARLLVAHPATESRPIYSPDGTRLAFVSTRTGNGDIYVLQLRTSELKRITFDDGREGLDNWSPDGKYLYFTSNRGEVSSLNDLYRVPSDGGTPVAVAADKLGDESQAAPNPANGTIAFTSGSMAVSQWWRKGHAHIDETRLGIVTPGKVPVYSTVLDNHAKNLWPMWSADGKRLYFMSDQSGAQNIWEKPLTGAARQVTKFTDGRVLYPGISADGKAIVFERDFQIWKLDPASGAVAPVAITVRGVPAGASATHLTLTSEFRNLALSPDGKKIAFTAHGEVFAASAKDGGNAVRLTSTAANEEQVAWAPDSRRVVYVSDRDGAKRVFLYDLVKETETALTAGGLSDESPAWSPDGSQVLYVRDRREIHVVNVATKEDRTLVKKTLRTFGRGQGGGSSVAWSPDGAWIAYFTNDVRSFRNVAVVPVAGGPIADREEKQLSFLSNSNASGLVWSPDRAFLLFSTGQRTEPRSIARVELSAKTPKFREDSFRDLFKDAPAGKADAAVAAVKKPVQIEFDGVRRRLTELPLGVDAGSPVISPDGKVLLFSATIGTQTNLYTYSLDELAREPGTPRQLTSTAGPKADAQFSPDGKEVFYLEAGKVVSMALDARIAKPLAVTAELDTEFDAEKLEIFQQAWTTVNETYYDPKFHGVNWSDLRGQYRKWAEAARSQDELRRVISLMLGELNSSHSGISAGPGASASGPTTGRLGMTLDPADFTVVSVLPLGPAANAGIQPGEKLLSINGKVVGPGVSPGVSPEVSVDELLQYRVGKRTVVSTSGHKDLALMPVNAAAEKKLVYRQWVEERRAYVSKVSGGRLGYVHIADMSQEALDQLYLDLDTANQSREGVVIDIRSNNGGFVNAYALDVFTRRPYLTMTTRDNAATPARSALGQRSLELPTVLVVDQNSLSDAEDFTEGYRSMKLGKVVGVPTAGWIIYTGSAALLDGSALRTPGTKITANDGTDMELHPRPVDVTVERVLGESYSGKDAQLDTAVRELLAGLK